MIQEWISMLLFLLIYNKMMSQQKLRLNRVRKNVQSMLHQAKQVTTKRVLALPPLLTNHASHSTIHLTPIHSVNQKLHFLMRQPSLPYRKISRNKHHSQKPEQEVKQFQLDTRSPKLAKTIQQQIRQAKYELPQSYNRKSHSIQAKQQHKNLLVVPSLLPQEQKHLGLIQRKQTRPSHNFQKYHTIDGQRHYDNPEKYHLIDNQQLYSNRNQGSLSNTITRSLVMKPVTNKKSSSHKAKSRRETPADQDQGQSFEPWNNNGQEHHDMDFVL